MLTDNLNWKVERIVTAEYAKIEADLLDKIVKDFWKGKDLSIENWRIRKLAQLASFQDSWKKTLAQLEKKAYPEILAEIEKAMRQSAEYDDWVIKKVKGDIEPFTASAAFKTRLEAVISKTKEAMNLTGTQALQKAEQDFLEAINSAYLQVLNGADTLDNALRESVKALAHHGMSVQYITPSGRLINYSLDASIRRDIITTLNQTASQYSLDRANEYGTDLVQVSAHFGARPSHAVWQGKVFSISGKTKGYQKLEDATGYGTAGGLCGVNCRHTFFPYFAGYSKDIDDSEIPGLRENKEQYENQQMQRKYERTLRMLKREKNASDIIGDRSSAMALNERIKSVRSEYLAFLDKKGLTRFSERER